MYLPDTVGFYCKAILSIKDESFRSEKTDFVQKELAAASSFYLLVIKGLLCFFAGGFNPHMRKVKKWFDSLLFTTIH